MIVRYPHEASTRGVPLCAGDIGLDRTPQHGFSLLSVIITIAIVAILSGLAAPSFTSIVKNARMSKALSSISQSLRVARSEAAKRSVGVSICAISSIGVCGGVDWSKGWLVYSDSRSDGVVGVKDGNDELISMTAMGLTGVEIRATQLGSSGFVGAGQLRFDSSGESSWTTGTFQVCDTDSGVTPRAMILTAAGTFRNITPSVAGTDGASSINDPAGNEVCQS